MIDWLDFEFPYFGPDIVGGYLFKVDQDGSVRYEIPQWLSVEGSWSARVVVRAETGRFRISGNPHKFLTGQNVFGPWDYSEDVKRLLFRFAHVVLKGLGVDVSLMALQDKIKIHRIDLNRMFKVGTNDQVNEWLNLARQYATGRHQMTTAKGSTVYIGQHSRRKAWKFYNKREEMKRHPPLSHGDRFRYLHNFASGCVRAELVLRGQYLDSKQIENGAIVSRRKKTDGTYYKSDAETTLRYLKNWGSDMAKVIYLDEIRKTNLPANAEKLCATTLDDSLIPTTYRSTYLLWARGIHVSNALPRSTYYRHKRYFKEHHGIDIDCCSDQNESGIQLPLLDLLIGQSFTPLQSDIDWFMSKTG